MKLLYLVWACILLVAPVYGQHVHLTPHTTTHFDTYRHGNHTHTVPHTTTHYDAVWHSPAYVPHTTTHYDTYRHGNHTHTVPHTTTHLDPVYPSIMSSGGYGASVSSGYYPSMANSSVLYPPASPAFSNVAPSVANPNVSGIVSAQAALTDPGYSSSKPIVAGNVSNGSLATNVIPSKPAPSAPGIDRRITLTNPADSGGNIKYAVNEFPFTIAPGETQTLNMDRDWTIRFDNGRGRVLSYRLEEGKYKFSVSQSTGWDVGKVPESRAPAPPAMGPVF